MNLEQLMGTKVLFTGFTAESDKDLPPNHEALDEGQRYELTGFTPEDDKNEASAVLAAPNPDFNPQKRASSKANPREVGVVVFLDEFAVSKDDEQGEEEEPAIQVVSQSTVDEEEIDLSSEEDQAAEEEVAAAPPAKKVTKAAARKAAAEKKAAAAEAKAAAAEKKATTKKTTTKKATTKKATTKKAVAKKASAPVDEIDEDLKDLVTFEDGQEDEEIVALVEEAGDNLCELVEGIAEETAQSEFRLGGVLYHTRKSKAFRKIKDGEYDVPSGFGFYVQAELSLGYRKAMNLIQIYQQFTLHGLGADEVSLIKWTKASLIASRLNSDDELSEESLNRLLEIAEDSSADDLRSTIKESFSKKNGEADEMVRKVTFKFRLTEDEAAAVQTVMEEAKKMLNTKDDAAAFAHIALEWASDNLGVAGADEVEHESAVGVGQGKATEQVHQEH